jgi:hypothetical protein
VTWKRDFMGAWARFWPTDAYHADGIMIETAFSHHRARFVFIEHVLSYYNYLRWA